MRHINENKFLVCIADVSGKGIPAALMMSNVQASIRTMIRNTEDLKKIVEEFQKQFFLLRRKMDLKYHGP